MNREPFDEGDEEELFPEHDPEAAAAEPEEDAEEAVVGDWSQGQARFKGAK